MTTIRSVRRPWLLRGLAACFLLGTTACQAWDKRVQVFRTASITAEARLGATFTTEAGAARVGDIERLALQLVDTATGNPVGSPYNLTRAMVGGTFGSSVTIRFSKVRNGTYRLRAEAFDGSGSITQPGGSPGGPLGYVQSAGTVTVNALATPPVSGALSVTLPLRSGTGETVNSSIVVREDGSWDGLPEGAEI